MGGGLHEPGLERDRERVRVCTCPVVGVSSRKEYSRFCEESTLNADHRRGLGPCMVGGLPVGSKYIFIKKIIAIESQYPCLTPFGILYAYKGRLGSHGGSM